MDFDEKTMEKMEREVQAQQRARHREEEASELFDFVASTKVPHEN